MPYGTPSKDMKRPSWSKKSDKWDKFKEGSPKNPSSGPMSKANTMGDQGYDKEADA